MLLQADILELKANPEKRAAGVVLEARLEKGQGPVATMLVREGTLRVGDPIVAGSFSGRVRFMHDDHGERVDQAGPADPVEVVGLSGVPSAGDRFFVPVTEKQAKVVAETMAGREREAKNMRMTKVSLENLFEQIQEESVKELKIILKGDVHGSVEAVTDAMSKIGTDQVKVNVVHSGVGGITETDINFASASNALVIGFNVRPSQEIRDLAQQEGIQIKVYSVIYELLDDVTKALEGMLDPIKEEVPQGKAEVRNTFSISRIGTIAGCYVLEGRMVRNGMIRVVREKEEVFNGRVASLKRFGDDVREVQKGLECGVQVDGFDKVQEGDILECYTIEETAPKLGQAQAT
ncbi:MAG: translation initiation factor IF-2 [Deltaproteobacteria bacterium]|nr:translation initiation factor IF-2 [Deltaproteobacteria bacterium]